MQYKKLWSAFGLIMLISFSVLGGVGYKAINNGPPIPAKVVTTDGRLLFTGETIRDGQNVWQSTGGQEIGTIWGHGAYVAPDWSADYLHRQSEIVLNRWDTFSCPPGVNRGFRNVDTKDSVLLTIITGGINDRNDIGLPPAVARQIEAVDPHALEVFTTKLGLRFDAGPEV